MTAKDTLLNNILKAVEQHNRQNKKKITPLQALKIYCNMIR